ncbi:DHA2 family efflux MFS transporter permease subunit [Frankia sp. Mgl5]|nr:DHA2 family efflux MFS transporter permease subunit [Frankia sp. Mgl5]MCK9928206.1 DHA2 family efflux MFS transporter permease subunit [Frankia sp. Mgl5]
MTDKRSATVWTFVVTSITAFMVALDNLVVTTALPQIRDDLGAGLEGLEWVVNAYTLPFAVLLLTGAALGDRLGRRAVFATGLGVFTLGSLGAALAPSIEALIAARAMQGVGAALVLPLSLTLLSAAVPPERRGAALGVWGAMSGLAVAVGPLVGGAITDGASWQWIFWLNVPIGLVTVPLALRRLTESRGPAGRLDLPGVVIISAGLLGVTLGLVRGESHGWTSPAVLTSLLAGAAGVGAFIAWERRVARRGGSPMLPMSLFRRRGFAAVNAVSLLFSVGMFGSIFLLAQALQNVFDYSPLEAGIRTLPWTAMPLLIAPIAGPLSDRIGGRPLIVAGMAIEAVSLAWLATILDTGADYAGVVPPFVLAGVGMALFFVPVASVALGSVPAEQEGLASGTNNAMRELGGVLGVAVLASVFAANGGYASPGAFVDGTRPALWVGAAVLLTAAAVATLLPSPARTAAPATPPAPAMSPAPATPAVSQALPVVGRPSST